MTSRLRRAVSSSIILPLLVALGTSTACRRDEPGPQHHLVTTRARANPPPELPSNELGRGTNAVAPGEGEEDSHRGLTSDAALPVPEPLREDVPLAADLLTARDVAGLILEAEWQWSDVPPPPSVPELSSEGLQDAATSTRLRVRVELAMSGRMRFVFEGHGYPWPDATELRSRADRFGHLLVWPDGAQYRVVLPGALRALFADRRLDVGPLVEAVTAKEGSGKLLDLPVERTRVSTAFGVLYLDRTEMAGMSNSAGLLCRLLVELIAVQPSTHVCSAGGVVLRARYEFSPKGKLTFQVTRIGRRQELTVPTLEVPPEDAAFRDQGLPSVPGGTIPRSLIVALHTRTITPGTPSAGAPAHGLTAVNHRLGLRALVVDSIPVMWLGAGEERALPELRSGKYSVGWRDFFGTDIEPPRTVLVPSRVTVGAPEDGGSG